MGQVVVVGLGPRANSTPLSGCSKCGLTCGGLKASMRSRSAAVNPVGTTVILRQIRPFQPQAPVPTYGPCPQQILHSGPLGSPSWSASSMPGRS
jgi:hypothetical protein